MSTSPFTLGTVQLCKTLTFPFAIFFGQFLVWHSPSHEWEIAYELTLLIITSVLFYVELEGLRNWRILATNTNTCACNGTLLETERNTEFYDVPNWRTPLPQKKFWLRGYKPPKDGRLPMCGSSSVFGSLCPNQFGPATTAPDSRFLQMPSETKTPNDVIQFDWEEGKNTLDHSIKTNFGSGSFSQNCCACGANLPVGGKKGYSSLCWKKKLGQKRKLNIGGLLFTGSPNPAWFNNRWD